MLCLLFASYIILSNEIFDDVFRTMLEKMPKLAVPLINEIFGTSYPEDIEIIQRKNLRKTAILSPALLYHEVRESRSGREQLLATPDRPPQKIPPAPN